MNSTRRHIERRKKIQGPMAFIGTLETADNFAVAGTDIASGSFQRLNTWFFIHRNHQGFFWWSQVEPYNISCLWCKLWIGADAPASLPGQTNVLLSKDAPNCIIGYAEMSGNRRTVPAGLTVRWRLLQGLQDACTELLVIFRRLAGTWPVVKPGNSFSGKAVAPIDDCVRTHFKVIGNLTDRILRQEVC